MLLFNKPQVNEKELMIQQRKKASFTSKCAKFEGVKEPILTKKESLTKVRCEESRFLLNLTVITYANISFTFS